MRRQQIAALWSEGQPFPGKLDSECAIEMVIYDMDMPEKVEFLHLLLKSNEREYPENWKISKLLIGDKQKFIYPTKIDNRKSLYFNWFK